MLVERSQSGDSAPRWLCVSVRNDLLDALSVLVLFLHFDDRGGAGSCRHPAMCNGQASEATAPTKCTPMQATPVVAQMIVSTSV